MAAFIGCWIDLIATVYPCAPLGLDQQASRLMIFTRGWEISYAEPAIYMVM